MSRHRCGLVARRASKMGMVLEPAGRVHDSAVPLYLSDDFQKP